MDRLLNQFYGFRHTPFGPTVGPEGLFCSRSNTKLVQDVVAEMSAAVVVLSIRGGVGVGKTSLMHMLAAELQAHGVRVVQITRASHHPLKVLRLIGATSGVDEAGDLKPDQLFQRLRAAQAFNRLVLIVDDAEALSVAMFRYLELLTELRHAGMADFHLVLIGGPGPWAGVVQAGLEGGRWAGSGHYFVCALGPVEAAAYLDHKFRWAGQSLHRIMTKAAVAEVVSQAGGIPTELDLLTRLVLVEGYVKGHRRVSLKDAQRALTSGATISPPRGGPLLRAMPAIAAAVSVIAVGTTTIFAMRDVPAGADRASAIAALWPVEPPQAAVAAASGRDAAAVHQPPVRPPAAVARVDRLQTDAAMAGPTAGAASGLAVASLAPTPGATVAAGPHPVLSAQTPIPDDPSLPVGAEQPTAAVASGSPAQSAALGATVGPDMAPVASGPLTHMPAPALDAQSPLLEPAAGMARSATSAPHPPALIAQSPPPESGPPAVIAAADTAQPAARTTFDPRQSPLDSDISSLEAWVPRPRPQAPDSSMQIPNGKGEAPTNRGAPGLVLVAGAGDDLATLYARVYRGLTPPPYPAVVAINRVPVKPGSLVTFPEPPGGWSAR